MGIYRHPGVGQTAITDTRVSDPELSSGVLPSGHSN
jgi:hypothetical protein